MVLRGLRGSVSMWCPNLPGAPQLLWVLCVLDMSGAGPYHHVGRIAKVLSMLFKPHHTWIFQDLHHSKTLPHFMSPFWAGDLGYGDSKRLNNGVGIKLPGMCDTYQVRTHSALILVSVVKGISTPKKVSRCYQAQILFDGASAVPPLRAVHVGAHVGILTYQEQLQNI